MGPTDPIDTLVHPYPALPGDDRRGVPCKSPSSTAPVSFSFRFDRYHQELESPHAALIPQRCCSSDLSGVSGHSEQWSSLSMTPSLSYQCMTPLSMGRQSSMSSWPDDHYWSEPASSSISSNGSVYSPVACDFVRTDPIQGLDCEAPLSSPYSQVAPSHRGFPLDHPDYPYPPLEMSGKVSVDPREVQQYPDSIDETGAMPMDFYDRLDGYGLLQPEPIDSTYGWDQESVAPVAVQSVGRPSPGPGVMRTSTEDRSGRRQMNHKVDVLRSQPKDSKVTKRGNKKSTPTCPEHPEETFASIAELKKHTLSRHLRPYKCILAPYGCTKDFGSKNEWKRHVNTQHLCCDTWRCDIDACADGSVADDQRRDFNRKDLFTEHLRRMHGPPTVGSSKKGAKKDERSKREWDRWNAGTTTVAERCRIWNRDPPARSQCGFCDQIFEGQGSWDERMEHVGRHHENLNNHGHGHGHGKAERTWTEDILLRDYLAHEGLIRWCARRGQFVMTTKNARDDVEADAEGEEADY
ncbi:MAG: hypothetical protein M1817_002506 [Caeruleum heppii]|nr:MAG: hypothetical protein M1817_002506 [Caeruleum heppii]